MSQQGPQQKGEEQRHSDDDDKPKGDEKIHHQIGGEMMGRGKTLVIGRDSEEEKKGEFSKKVTSTERKYR